MNALLRCGYRRQREDSWRGTPQGSCVQQSNLPYSLPLTISTYRRRRQPSSSRRPPSSSCRPPLTSRRPPLLLSPIRRHGQHPPCLIWPSSSTPSPHPPVTRKDRSLPCRKSFQRGHPSLVQGAQATAITRATSWLLVSSHGIQDAVGSFLDQ